MRYWILSTFLILGGCGHGTTGGANAPGTGVTRRATGPLSDDLVGAVTNAKSRTPIDLKFRVKQRPVVDTAVEIELALLVDSRADVERVQLNVAGIDGLDVLSESRLSFDQLQSDEPQLTTVVAMPRRPGIYYVTATAIVDGRSSSITRVYSIPVVVPAAS